MSREVLSVSPRKNVLLERKSSLKNDPKILISTDYDQLSERAAIIVASRLLESPSLCMSVSVGRTPTGIYNHLVKMAKKGTINFSRTNIFLMDEFYGSSELKAAPHRTELSTVFFNEARMLPERINAPDTKLSPQQAAATYKEIGLLRRLDLAIVHVGPNGNIGWLNQHSPHDQGCHVVDISKAADNCGYDYCITFGMENLLNAKEVLILGVGLNKAQLIKKVMADTRGTTPAGALLYNHPHATLLIDVEAASLLSVMQESIIDVKGFTIQNEKNRPSGKNVICFAPHPDDTSISAGATLAFLAETNNVVSCVCTTGHRAYIPDTTPEERIKIREAEATEEAILLGVSCEFLHLPLYNLGNKITTDPIVILDFLKKFNPNLIYMPHTGDTHETHRACVKSILLALQKLFTETSNRDPIKVYMYEGPWSLFSKGSYNTVVSPPSTYFAKKMAAIGAHKSQTDRTPYDRAADSLAILRASLVPEQDLAGFGGNPPKLEERVELFFNFTIRLASDVDTYLNFVDESRPPRI